MLRLLAPSAAARPGATRGDAGRVRGRGLRGRRTRRGRPPRVHDPPQARRGRPGRRPRAPASRGARARVRASGAPTSGSRIRHELVARAVVTDLLPDATAPVPGGAGPRPSTTCPSWRRTTGGRAHRLARGPGGGVRGRPDRPRAPGAARRAHRDRDRRWSCPSARRTGRARGRRRRSRATRRRRRRPCQLAAIAAGRRGGRGRGPPGRAAVTPRARWRRWASGRTGSSTRSSRLGWAATCSPPATPQGATAALRKAADVVPPAPSVERARILALPRPGADARRRLPGRGADRRARRLDVAGACGAEAASPRRSTRMTTLAVADSWGDEPETALAAPARGRERAPGRTA